MIVSLKWLRDYVDIPLSVNDLADRLTMVGLEIEGIRQQSEFLEKVMTVRLEEIRKHPRADRLHLCKVSDGRKTYRVVCGAPNLEPGITVPLALPGGTLPSGMTLEETHIRGELSQGMLCSQKELQLGEDASGIWHLPPETPIGVPLAEALGRDDVILEVGITPNRSDCLSIIGIAREIAAICGASLRYPPVSVEEQGPSVDTLSSVTVLDSVGCPRYTARIVEGVRIGPSPAWLRQRLEAVGLRPINNIVDVTNFILMELGQPLHAFDFDRLSEHRIVVRRAKEGERFTTLDGVERTLFDDTLLICDGSGPVAIAGIMGGLDSEITSDTTRVLIESAYFQPQCIRRSSKKLGLRSESSYRFERGIDPDGVLRALDRAAQLMQEVGGGKIASGRIDVYPHPIERPVLTLRVARTAQFLGTPIEAPEMAKVLRSIEMDVEPVDSDRLKVIPPSFRPDITREVDLSEEVARLIGYDRIPVTYPEVVIHTEPDDPHRRMREEAKGVLKECGFFELITYSFISLQSLQKLGLPSDDPRLRPLQLLNPLTEEQAVMRTSLIPALIQTVRYNFDRQNDDLRVFELSKVFLPRKDNVQPNEAFHLVGALTGKRNPHLLYGGEAEVDYADVKGSVECILDLFHGESVRYAAENLPPYLDPAAAATVFFNGEPVGVLGRLHPEIGENFDLKKPVFLFELDFDRLYALGRPRPLYQPLPKFPSVVRDMALIVDEDLPVQEPLDFILKEQEPFLERTEIFDLYRNPQFGAGKKSVGYRLTYRAADRSLTDDEVNDIHNRLVKKVLDTFRASLR